MELLSPAGNRDALVAAISCGADAVYLGYTAFGARSYAGNFDAQQLLDAIEYAHEREKKIYVTVNTLVKQCEVDDLCDVLELLVRVGADAAIVQDMGVVRIAKERFPELTLHASTQMTVNNAQGAQILKDLGLTRIVPARECALPELGKMADTGVEVEAFAHGALCVAVSGQCLFSSMIGGRSGNRGKCAQPCRLPYQLENGQKGYLLSTRDLMLLDRIPQMRDAGVYSFKLEGRMKRPEYVGVITSAYRKAIDAAEAHIEYHPDEDTVRGLKQIFNRGGFTEGYVMGKSNAALMSWERPNHWGIRLGKVASSRGQLARVLLDEPLNNGDGLQIRGSDEIDLTYSGNDMPKGSEATIRVASGRYKPGDTVYRLTDAVQMAQIREKIIHDTVRIPLSAMLKAIPGEFPELILKDTSGRTVKITGEQPVDHAKQRALDEESALKQLGKTGGTPYIIKELTLVGENAFMTTGMLNSLRRNALDAMRLERVKLSYSAVATAMEAPETLPKQEKLLIAQSENLEHAKYLLQAGADCFYWEPQIFTRPELDHALLNAETYPVLVLPAVMHTEELDEAFRFVCDHQEKIAGVALSNIGQFNMQWPVPVYGMQGLNVTNVKSAVFYTKLGAKRLTASCELSLKELRELKDAGGNYEIEAYGRTMMMLLNHCPRRTAKGDEKHDAACNACASNGGYPDTYTDRKGYRFLAKRQRMKHGCVVKLYNSVPTDMSRSSAKIHSLCMSLRLTFTDETLDRQIELVSSYRSVLDLGNAIHIPTENATSGHLNRGVE